LTQNLPKVHSRWLPWILALGAAGAFFLAASGLLIRPAGDVPAWRTTLGAGFLLVGLTGCALYADALKTHAYLSSLTAPILLALWTQTTGGWASPLAGFLFPLLALWAWTLGLRHAVATAALYLLLEYAGNRMGLPPWQDLATRFVILLFFILLLKKVAEIRRQKEKIQGRLEHLHREAGTLAASAEPSSFIVPKDQLLQQEKRLGARVNTVLELETSLRKRLDLARTSLDCHTAACFLVGLLGGKRVLRLRAYSSKSKSLAPDSVIPFGETLVGLAGGEKRKVLVDPLAPESSKGIPYYAQSQPIRALLAQPIWAQAPEGSSGETELVGVFVVDSLESGYFTESRVSLSETFGEWMGDAVQNARLLHFSGTKSRNLDALYQASQAFSTLLEEEQVLETTLQTAVGIFDPDSAFVCLPGETDPSLRIQVGRGSFQAGETLEGLDAELARWVIESGKPFRYSRGTREGIPGPFARRDGLMGSVQSCLMVPLGLGERSVGVVRLDSKEVSAFHEYDQEVLSTLANQAGLALENARGVRKVRELAVRDGLTGLYNHRYFQEKLTEEILKAERYNKDLCLVLVDVDHFKKFNDQFGHQEGDRVLREVAQSLGRTVRQGIDTVARYGGEEFVVILPETAIQAGTDLADRIRERVEGLLIQRADGQGVYRVTLSLGTSAYPFDSREPGKLIQCADEALYEAKRNGRNRVIRYQFSMGQKQQ